MNEENDGIKQLDEVLNCPSCQLEITFLKDLVNTQPVQRGNLVVCSGCGTICKVGDSNLVKLKREEFVALDSQSKATLSTISMGILAKNVNDRSRPEGGIN